MRRRGSLIDQSPTMLIEIITSINLLAPIKRKNGGIRIIEDKLETTSAKEILPGGIGKRVRRGNDRSKPVIKDNVKKGRDLASTKVENKWNVGSMLRGETNKHTLTGAGVPTWYLLSISNLGLQGIGRTAPDMGILELATGPGGTRHEINGGKTSLWIWCVIVQPDGIGDCHGPQCRGVHFAPADSSMKHGSASHRHDSLDGPLSNTVLMMGTNTSKVGCLAEGEKILGKGRRSEDRRVVRHILRDNNTHIRKDPLKLRFGSKRLMRVEANVHLGKDIFGSGINE